MDYCEPVNALDAQMSVSKFDRGNSSIYPSLCISFTKIHFKFPLALKPDIFTNKTIYKNMPIAHYLLTGNLVAFVAFLGTLLRQLPCRNILPKEGYYKYKNQN